jgi:3-hydroxyisobutyrate dehydrogenase-like beta-hydroxyacid dehydrogenase
MDIATIGAGNVGGGLAAAARGAGHGVTVSASSAASAERAAATTGARAAASNAEVMARTLEDLAFANISLNATRGGSWQSAFRLVGPQAGA